MSLKNYFVKPFLLPFLKERGEIKKEKVRKILILGQHMGLGNLLMFTPTVKAFKEHFVNANISLVLNQQYLIELMKVMGLIDKFLLFRENASFIEKIWLMSKIRTEKFDMIVKNFIGSSYTIIGLSGIPHRVGNASSPGWSIPKDYVFNYTAIMEKNEHEVDRNLSLFYAVVGSQEGIERNFTLAVPEGVREYAIRFMEENNIKKGDRIVGMQVGAMKTWKQWDLDKMTKIADILIGQYKSKVVFLGGNGEVEQAQYIERKMNNLVVNMVGKTTLPQTSALIEQCKFFICNDTGLMHLSIAVNTPVIAIFGPTDYIRTGPWKEGNTIIRKDLSCSPCYKTSYSRSKIEHCPHHNCLKLITVEDVMRVVKQYIKN